MENIEVYLDMDGVLANFDKSINDKKVHLEELEEAIWQLAPELRNKDAMHMKEFFKGVQEDPVLAKAKKVHNIYRNKFYSIMSKPNFFLDLEPMPDFMNLVDGVIKLNNGKLPNILTAPVRSDYCAQEKEKWCYKHIPGKFNRFICQKNKTEYADPFAILIDDMTKNTVPWDAAGGFAVLHTGNVKNSLQQVAVFIEQVKTI